MRWRPAQTPHKIRVYSPARAVIRDSLFHSLAISVKQTWMNRALFIVISVLLVALATPAFAGSKKKKATPAQYHAPVISNVTGNTITVSEEKTTRTFIITQFTEINVNGQRAAVADLKPGMTVSVTIGVDPTRASRIVATGAPVGRGQKKKK